MKLEDAFKESDIPAAKRVENGYQVIILYLPDNQGVLMRRMFPSMRKSGTTELEEEIFPHLGALIYKAIKKRYTEVRRYARDWQPLCDWHPLLDATAVLAMDKEEEEEEEEEEGYYDIESEFTYINSEYDDDDNENPYDAEMGELYSSEFLDEYDY